MIFFKYYFEKLVIFKRGVENMFIKLCLKRKYFYGIILSLLITVSAYFIKSFTNIDTVSFSIITGIILRTLLFEKFEINSGSNLIEKYILSFAIGLLGVELQFGIILKLGYKPFIFIISLMTFTIICGFIFGKLFGLSKKAGLLVGIGNAVCGSSAIAAAAPIIKNNEEEIGLSVSLVNFLGTIGIFLMPFLTNYYKIDSNLNAGILIGGTLQAVGQVVAAGYSINNDVGTISVLVKMVRILLLGPLLMILIFIIPYFTKNKENKIKPKIKVPYFIVLFFIFSLISSFEIIEQTYINYIKLTGKFLLVLSMSAIGLKIKLSSIIKNAPKYLLAGIFIVISQILFYFLFLKIYLEFIS
jgi:uncharacterized integral membrane protein (TIGR00698 family)